MIDGDDENNDHQVFDEELTAPAINDLFAMNAGTGRDTLVESTPMSSKIDRWIDWFFCRRWQGYTSINRGALMVGYFCLLLPVNF